MTRPTGFTVSRTARTRFADEDAPATERGHLRVLDRAGVRRLAARMNEMREAGTPSAQAGEIVALGLLHEIFHLLVERYEHEVSPGTVAAAADALETAMRADGRRVLRRFADEFPTADGETQPEGPLDILEELLLTRVANENPAVGAAAAPVRRPAGCGADPVRAGARDARGDTVRGPRIRPRGRVAARAAACTGTKRARIAGGAAALHPGPLAHRARRRSRAAHG